MFGTFFRATRYKYADIRAGSLEKRRQRAVCSRVNARPEHLFSAFENSYVKLNRLTHIVAAITLVSGIIKFMQIFAGVL